MPLEKDLYTQVELIQKQKKERKQEMKQLQGQDQELCGILCVTPYAVDGASVPSLEELNHFRQHVATLRETKVSALLASTLPKSQFDFPVDIV